jgi:NTE family protein
MSGTALVLSGGGAKGAFQVGAEKYLREVKGYRWDIIAGVSVGALNGAMLAMGKYDRLEAIWRGITNDQVYTGGINPWTILKLIFGAKSLYGNGPLWRLIQQEIELDRMQTELRIGAVSLRTGEYQVFRPPTAEGPTLPEPEFARAVLASTAIPIIWAPVDISPDLPDMVDGGVRNVSPIGDVLDTGPDEVVIINCNPQLMQTSDGPLRNALTIGKLALETTMNEIFITDIREFQRINRLALQAREAGVTLYDEDGDPYTCYASVLIEPDEPLGDTLAFSPEAAQRYMAAGWAKAKAVVG